MTRRRFRAAYLSVSVVVLGLTLSAFRHKDYLTFPFRNGDHMYYVATALQYTGLDYLASLQRVADMFPDWPGIPSDLNYGFQSPSIAPLIYVRVAYPLLLAVFMGVFGSFAIFLLPAFLGSISIVLVWAVTRTHFGSGAARFAFLVCCASSLFLRYGFGLYLESLVIPLLLLILLVMPAHATDSSWTTRRTISAVALAVLLGLTRQMPAVPILLAGAGYLVEVKRSKHIRNSWLIPSLWIVGASTFSYFLLTLWAPYNPLPYLAKYYHLSSTRALIQWIPLHYFSSLNFLGSQALRVDPFLIVLLTLAIIGVRRSGNLSWLWLSVAAFGGASVNLMLNRPEYRFLVPIVPLLLPAAAAGIYSLTNRNQQDQPHSFSTRNVTLVMAVACTLAVTTVLFSIVHYAPSHERVAAYQLPTSGAGSDLIPIAGQGPIECFGDDGQLWVRDDSGRQFALSGSAMSHSFRSLKSTDYAAATGVGLTGSQILAYVADCTSRAKARVN